MGKKKIAIEPIKNNKTRRLTLNKRKKGLIKEAMELSILCNADVFIEIKNKDNPSKSTMYSSSDFRSMTKIFERDLSQSNCTLIHKEDYERIFRGNIYKRDLNIDSNLTPFASLRTSHSDETDDINFNVCNLVENNDDMKDDRYDSNVFDQSNLSSTFSDLSEDTIK